MTLHELFTSDASPLTDEQKKELSNEYLQEVSGLNEKIRELERKNGDKQRQIESMKSEAKAFAGKAIGCLTSVKAMLNHANGCGATHRMKAFYAEAMVKYIDGIATDLEHTDIDGEIPF